MTTKNGKYLSGIVFFIFAGLLLLNKCSNAKTDKTFRIGRDSSWYAINLMGKEKNLGAFTDEFLSNIARQEHLRIVLLNGRYEELLTRMENGEFDGILTNMQPESSYEQTLLFSNPFILLGPVLVVSANSKLKTWEELKFKIIGIQSQSPSILELTQDSSLLIKLYDNIINALEELVKNRIDGVILPAWTAYTYTHTFYPNQLRIATNPLTQEGLRLVAPNNPTGKKLVDHFNQGLEALKKNGIYEKLILKWGLVDPEKFAR